MAFLKKRDTVGLEQLAEGFDQSAIELRVGLCVG